MSPKRKALEVQIRYHIAARYMILQKIGLQWYFQGTMPLVRCNRDEE